MNWLKKIIGLCKKGDEKCEEEKDSNDKEFLPPPADILPTDKINWCRKIRECGVCKKNILPEERITKTAGFYFHTSCLKSAKSFCGM